MIILYHHRTASRDGQFVHIEELVRSLRKLGHEVDIVGPAVKEASFGGVASSTSGLRKRRPSMLYEVLELAYAGLDFLILSHAILRKRPDIIYERYNLMLPSGIWAKRVFKFPLLLEVNAPLYEERLEHSGLKLRRLAAWTERYAWRSADRVLAVTDVLANIVSEQRGTRKGVHVIHNGVDTTEFSPREPNVTLRERYGIESKVVIGFVGFVREWHGLEPVLRSLCATTNLDWHLVIIGDGPARETLERTAESLNCSSRLSMVGLVGRDEIANHLALFDIALQPDVVPYASPLKLFEYMSMGLAIVAVDTANIREILTDGQDGLFFPRGDTDAFVLAIRRLCYDDSLRSDLGRAAVRTIEDRGFLWSKNAERVVEIASLVE